MLYLFVIYLYPLPDPTRTEVNWSFSIDFNGSWIRPLANINIFMHYYKPKRILRIKSYILIGYCTDKKRALLSTDREVS